MREILSEKSDEELKSDIIAKWKTWLMKYLERLQSEAKLIEEGKLEFKTLEELKTWRKNKMKNVNPIYVLRNYVAEESIKKAEKGDFSMVNRLLELLLSPFTEQENDLEGKMFKNSPPLEMCEICVSCSS